MLANTHTRINAAGAIMPYSTKSRIVNFSSLKSLMMSFIIPCLIKSLHI